MFHCFVLIQVSLNFPIKNHNLKLCTVMLPESPVSTKSSLSTSLQSLLNPMEHTDTEGPEEQEQCTTISSSPLACWATQALCDLAVSETELRRYQARQTEEAKAVSQSVERALQGVQREERRLLERVEQDHRDLQCKLEYLQKENLASIRAGQLLVDQRLHKIYQLQEQIKRSQEQIIDVNEHVCNVDPKCELLLKDVAELLQPCEISLALQHVSFKPSAQPNAILFGEIKVQDHSVHFSIGGSGSQGKACSIHATKKQYDAWTEPKQETRSSPDGAGYRQEKIAMPSNNFGSKRVVKKIKMSVHKQDSSIKEKCESLNEGEIFLAVPELLNNAESKSEDCMFMQNGPIQHFASHQVRKQKKLSQSHSIDSSFCIDSDYKDLRCQQKPSKITSRFMYSSLQPAQNIKKSISSQSCHDLLAHGRPSSRLSTSSDDHAYNRSSSPADSVDSGYTFIVSSSKNSYTSETRLSKSSFDLSHPDQTLNSNVELRKWKGTRHQRLTLSGSFTTSEPGSHVDSSQRHRHQRAMNSGGVLRSQSMSFIDGSSQNKLTQYSSAGQKSKNGSRIWGDRNCKLALLETNKNSNAVSVEKLHLVRQFGKQGSGRADLTLPSGLHVTPQGQLYLVDSGNARVQVTDQYGNVLQQVTTQTNDSGGLAKRCRNFFDVAVNDKGLIALSCTAERALLIFNRHGRLLQTFGGGSYIAGIPRDELEAPRGVTVTQKDEFLVADIRKGTLTAIKLEPKTGSRLERTVVPGFHRPYLVTACPHTGLVAVSERGSETNRQPCVKVLGPDWNTLRILGVCSGLGPVLTSPWGICIDRNGAVLVADWESNHHVVLYPPEGAGRVIVSEGLSSPRGLALLPNGFLVVSDSMHHCIKIYQQK